MGMGIISSYLAGVGFFILSWCSLDELLYELLSGLISRYARLNCQLTLHILESVPE